MFKCRGQKVNVHAKARCFWDRERLHSGIGQTFLRADTLNLVIPMHGNFEGAGQ